MAKRVQVTGDIVLDWNIARVNENSGPNQAWNPADVVRACRAYGGARLAADLLGGLSPWPTDDWVIETPTLPGVDAPEAIQDFHRSYAMWSPHLRESKEGEKAQVWRVDDFLGLHRLDDLTRYRKHLQPQAEAASENVELVVLDDADLGFRDAPELWPQAITDVHHPAWIVVKMAGDIAAGKLWQHLVSSCAHRLVVVLDVNDLRRREVQVSRELSWERTAEDLYWELIHNPRVNAVSCCSYVVVSVGASGALLMSRPPATTPKAGADTPGVFVMARERPTATGTGASLLPGDSAETTEGTEPTAAAGTDAGVVGTGEGGTVCGRHPHCALFFDSRGSEAMWEEKRPGRLIGYTTCLTASIAAEIMRDTSAPDVRRAVQSGIACMRRLHDGGYGEFSRQPSQPRLGFPVADLVAIIRERPAAEPPAGKQPGNRTDAGKGIETLAWAEVPEPGRPALVRSRVERHRPQTGLWSILEKRCCDEAYNSLVSQSQVARAIVKKGANAALPGVPMAQFGLLCTADRSEIEGYQSIRALIGTYGNS